MRGIECTVPKCGHLHASNDAALVEALLQPFPENHPEHSFDRRSARLLVESDTYDDAEHEAKKRSWSDFAGFAGGGGGSSG